MPDAWSPVLVGVVAAAVLLYGFSKTAMPVAGVLAGPMLAVALSPTIASGFAVPLLLLGDLFGLFYFRQDADWKVMGRLVPGVLAGFAITAVLFRFVDIHTLGRIIGILILASVVLEVWRQRSERLASEEGPALENRLAIAFFGTLAGMTTMAANAGGAATTLYLVKMRVSMLAFMGTSTWFFFILNCIKVPIVGTLGFISGDTLLADLWFAPFIAVGALVGIFVFRRMNQQVFTGVALALSALVSVWLIVHG